MKVESEVAQAQTITPARLREQILDLSRQNMISPLSPWFNRTLDDAIASGYYAVPARLEYINREIIAKLTAYRQETGCETVVIGMSGGVDSALTAAMFKNAGWNVIGVTMPIHQDQAETDRGIEACLALGIEHTHIDLSVLFEFMLATQTRIDPLLVVPDDRAAKIRRGNVRARLRMITLYNLASAMRGLVASTDNISEMAASFFTIFGDQGDVSPIQSLTKSWEVPYLARLNGVPESTVRAKPTDGLGIDDGDEAQLGCSYLEWDLMVYAMSNAGPAERMSMKVSEDRRCAKVFDAVYSRMAAGWFKRMHPIKFPHPVEDRYGMLDRLDEEMFRPACVRKS